jgi:chromosome partitioning protein
MATVAVLSRKGGCGKSTLATHMAAWLASRGTAVTLGDLDHQQSARTWLGYRPASAAPIGAWVGNANVLSRPPLGSPNLVLDTPGGLHGLALFKVVMLADAIVIPVCSSAFDRESSAACWAELRAHPRVRSGRCRVACVGMRLDSRTDAEEVTQAWAESIGLPWLGALRSAYIYVRATENGLSIFDMPEKVAQVDRFQWGPIVDWLEPVFSAERSAARERTAPRERPVAHENTASQFAALQRPFATGADARPRSRMMDLAPAWAPETRHATGTHTAPVDASRGLAGRMLGLFGKWRGTPPPRFEAGNTTRSASLGM